MKKLKIWKCICWVHPIEGGDDYQVDRIYKEADRWNLQDVKKNTISFLKRKSCIINDFQIIEL